MPDLAAYLAFLAAVLAMQAVPGPDTMLVVSRGVGQGLRVAVFTVVGMTLLAGLIQLPLLALGIASLVQSSPLAFDILRWAGAAYLVWLGARLVLSRSGDAVQLREACARSALGAMREGLIVNLTNPNPLVFMLAFLPQFVDPAQGSVTVQLLVLGATQKATGLAVLGATAVASGTAGSFLARRPGFVIWQQRIAGAVMIALGLRLVVAGALGRVPDP
jgi:threonine/homoserine/homoserine lactone efflux protein